MTQVQILVGDLHRGHLGSTEVTNRFLLITYDWKELQTWTWSHCACLVEPHRLVSNMTYLGQRVTLTWGQILTRPFKVTMCMFQRTLPRGSRWCSNIAASLLSSKVMCKKKRFCQKQLLCHFWTLTPEPFMLAQIWWHVKERTAQKLANVFFPGSYLK